MPAARIATDGRASCRLSHPFVHSCALTGEVDLANCVSAELHPPLPVGQCTTRDEPAISPCLLRSVAPWPDGEATGAGAMHGDVRCVEYPTLALALAWIRYGVPQSKGAFECVVGMEEKGAGRCQTRSVYQQHTGELGSFHPGGLDCWLEILLYYTALGCAVGRIAQCMR